MALPGAVMPLINPFQEIMMGMERQTLPFIERTPEVGISFLPPGLPPME
jgi:hypothetical protein